jgi:HlyD family secretion protein
VNFIFIMEQGEGASMTYQHKSRSWRRPVFTTLSILLTGAIAAGCSSASASSGAVTVKTVAVTNAQLDAALELEGDVVASSSVNVLSKTAGDVAQVLKKRGDYVQQGEVIARLDSSDAERGREKNLLTRANLEAQLNKTREDIATNKSVLRNTIEKLQLQIADLQKSYNNLRNDYDSGLVAKGQVEKAETQLKAAQLDLDTAQKQLANLENTDPLAPLRTQIDSTALAAKDIEKSLSDFEIKAPISGVLTDLFPEQGISVSPGYVAGTIQQLNPVKIHADVTEVTAKQLRGVKELSFTSVDTGVKKTAAVTYLADVMSTQGKTYVLELTADNTDLPLKPGMRVKLQTPGSAAASSALSVPNAAVVREGNDSYVFIVAGDHAEKRKITLGRSSDAKREVLSGVKEQEQVVVSGQLELTDQRPIVVKNE